MLKPSLQLRLTQQLTMTPQLQQAIRLLQLPIMELQTQIQQALEENVMLEAEEPEAPAETQDNGPDADEPDNGADPEEFVEPERQAAQEAEVAVASEAGLAKTCRKQGPPMRRRVRSRRPRSSTQTAPRRRSAITCCGSSSSRISTRGPRRSARRSSMPINDDGYLTDDLDTIRATLAPDVRRRRSRKWRRCSSGSCSSSIPPASAHARQRVRAAAARRSSHAATRPGLALARTIATEHLVSSRSGSTVCSSGC